MIGGPGELTGTAIAHHLDMTRALSDPPTHSVLSMGETMSFTSSPPRRDLYELTQTLQGEKQKSAAEQGGFLVPETKPGRIAGNDWMEKRADHATAVWNGHYSVEGGQILWNTKPWCVMTPTSFQSFDTHAEALAYAFKENQ